jgi:hypothetical protein
VVHSARTSSLNAVSEYESGTECRYEIPKAAVPELAYRPIQVPPKGRKAHRFPRRESSDEVASAVL